MLKTFRENSQVASQLPEHFAVLTDGGQEEQNSD